MSRTEFSFQRRRVEPRSPVSGARSRSGGRSTCRRPGSPGSSPASSAGANGSRPVSPSRRGGRGECGGGGGWGRLSRCTPPGARARDGHSRSTWRSVSRRPRIPSFLCYHSLHHVAVHLEGRHLRDHLHRPLAPLHDGALPRSGPRRGESEEGEVAGAGGRGRRTESHLSVCVVSPSPLPSPLVARRSFSNVHPAPVTVGGSAAAASARQPLGCCWGRPARPSTRLEARERARPTRPSHRPSMAAAVLPRPAPLQRGGGGGGAAPSLALVWFGRNQPQTNPDKGKGRFFAQTKPKTPQTKGF